MSCRLKFRIMAILLVISTLSPSLRVIGRKRSEGVPKDEELVNFKKPWSSDEIGPLNKLETNLHSEVSHRRPSTVFPSPLLHAGEQLVAKFNSSKADLHVKDRLQSDSPASEGEVAPGKIYLPFSHITEEWLKIRPLVHCSGASLILTAKGRTYRHLLVDRVDASPVSVLRLPVHCGYDVRATWSDLVLIAPYDGCYILQENGSYVLPLLWLGSPVKISCPMTSATTHATPSGFCSYFGMAIKMEGPQEVLEKYYIKVNDEWVPLVSNTCAYLVSATAKELVVFIPFKAQCIRDGQGTINVLLVEKEYTLTCQPSQQYALPFHQNPNNNPNDTNLSRMEQAALIDPTLPFSQSGIPVSKETHMQYSLHRSVGHAPIILTTQVMPMVHTPHHHYPIPPYIYPYSFHRQELVQFIPHEPAKSGIQHLSSPQAAQVPQESSVPSAPQAAMVPQESSVPSAPQAAKVPQESSVPSAPQAAKVPQESSVPSAPQAAQVPSAPQAAKVPQESSVLSATQAAQVPSAPQAAKVPQESSVPQAAQVPSAPQAAKVPQESSVLSAPQAAKVPQESSVPQAAQVPSAPQAAKVPQESSVLSAPQAAQVPRAPQAAKVPQESLVPSAPQAAQVPSAPQAAKVPQESLVPSAPQAAQVPSAPQAAKVPQESLVPSAPQAAKAPQESLVPSAPQAAQVVQNTPRFPVLPNASSKITPSLTCTRRYLLAELPFAKMESIKVKYVKRNVWLPVTSVPAHCGYSLQRKGSGAVFFSPIPACHSYIATPSRLALSIKFWDPNVLQHHVLQFQCPYSSPPPMPTRSFAAHILPTASLMSRPTPSPSQPSKTKVPPSQLKNMLFSYQPSKPNIPPSLSQKPGFSRLPQMTPLPSEPPKPQVLCHSQEMSVMLPPVLITGLSVGSPSIGVKNMKAVLLDEAPSHCGYLIKRSQNGVTTIHLPYASCHMIYQDGQYRIILIYQLAEGHIVEALLSCEIPPSHECSLPLEQRLPCGPDSVPEVGCRKMGCCFSVDTATCYYPMDECTTDRHFVFSIPMTLTNPPLLPTFLVVAGNSSCTPQRVVEGLALFKIPLDGCGAHKYEVGKTMIYMLEILNTRQSLSLNYGTITRESPFRLLVECRYLPGTVASVGYLVKNPSLGPSIQAQGVFGVQLRIAKDQNYDSYYPQYHRPLRKLLGKPLYLEVRLLNPPDPSTVLLVHYCVAYPRSAQSAWVLIYDGCPNPLDVSPTHEPPPIPPEALANHVRRFTVSTFQFLPSKNIESTSSAEEEEEIYFMCATEVCLPSEGPCLEGCFDYSVDSPAVKT